MLIGEFESKVSDKNRIALPKKFREEIGDTLIITQGYEGCIILVDELRFLALTQEIRDGSFVNDAIRDTTRFLIGSAHEVQLDKQGRFVLPQSLRSFSGIEDEVILLGLMRWVEIWSRDVWIQRKTMISSDAPKIARLLQDAS
jgi:MraZ protein